MIDYQIHDLSSKQLNFGSWLLRHKEKVKIVLTLALLLFCLVSLGYGIFGFISYALEFKQDKKMLANLPINLIDFVGYQAKHLPKPLEISEPQIIYSGGSQYDFVALVKNPNEKRGVKSLSFQFISGNFISPTSSVVIGSNQTVYLLSLGNISQKRLLKPELKIVNIQWQSLNRSEQPKEIDILIEEPKFNTTSDNSHSWISFSATNKSLENIWEVVWQVVLYSGQRIVAANQITVERFLSGESRLIDMSWFEKLPKVTQIKVIPIINIYNKDNFFEIPGEAKESLY